METWEKRRGEILVPLNGDDTWYIVPAGWEGKGAFDWPIAQCENEADADAIIRDHKLAALAEALFSPGNGIGFDATGEMFIHDENALLDALCLLAELRPAIATSSAEGQS